jgi:cell wall-associated NlpC family hydrolase
LVDDAHVTRSALLLPLAGALVASLLALGLASPAGALAVPRPDSDAPYISATIPVAKGCIVLGREWAGNKVFLVQRRLGTRADRDRYLQSTYDAVKRFQQRHDLATTGRVNRATWKQLGLDRPFCMDRFTVQPAVKAKAPASRRIEAMIAWARQQVGRRYVWGGAGPIGYDCSGLALQAMYAGGRVVPKVTTWLHQRQDFGTATAVYRSGLRRVPVTERKRGDLVFYGPQGSMTHMAIYLGHGRVIEAVRPQVHKAGLFSQGVPLKPKVVRPFGR